MNVRKNLFVALLLAVGGVSLIAQDGPPPDEGKGGPGKGKGGPMMLTIEKLKEDLKLSDEQATKLAPLLTQANELRASSRKEMKELRDSGDKDAIRAKMQEMQAKIVKAFEPAKDFLSADQYKSLTEKLTARPGGKGKGPGGKK